MKSEEILIRSMLGFLGELGPENYIPQFGRHSEAKLVTSEVVLVVVSLQPVEVVALVLGGVDVVQGVVGEIVCEIAQHEAQPQSEVVLLVRKTHHLENGIVTDKDGKEGKCWRVDEAVTMLGKMLRVDRQHVVDAVQDEVQIADELVVEQMALTVENETVDEVFGQSEHEEAGQQQHEFLDDIDAGPVDPDEVVDHEGEGDEEDVVPLVVREHLEEVGLEHAGRIHEKPVRGVDHLQVALVVHVPYLRHEGHIGVNHALDLLSESADHHAVGHDERERVVRIHFLGDVLVAIVDDEAGSSRVMLGEGGGVEHVLVKYDKHAVSFGGVLLQLLIGFKFDVFLHLIIIVAGLSNRILNPLPSWTTSRTPPPPKRPSFPRSPSFIGFEHF